MISKLAFRTLIASLVIVSAASTARAADAPAPKQAAPSPTPAANAAAAAAARPPGADGTMPYAVFTKDAEKQPGLFTLWRKDGRVYIELKDDQFDKEYLQTATPANGLGGYGITSGQMFQMDARVIKFARDGKRVAILWPHTRFLADPNTPLADAVRLSTADSVEGTATIVSENKEQHVTVLDLSALLGDVSDLTTSLNDHIADPKNPLTQYRLDPTRSYFGISKAFPKNVIIEADQTFASLKPEVINTVVDPRSIQMRVKYNFLEIPASPDYMPRLADDRVGYWSDPHISFDHDAQVDNRLHYILRWNIKASDPSKPLSPAVKPILWTITNTVPVEYRQSIRDAVLTWNKAFEKIGISGAMQVQDQPNDPNFDPEDVRYNPIRWLTESNSGGFAEAQIMWNPRTGEIFRGGVLIDSDLMRLGKRFYGTFVADHPADAATLAAQYAAEATQSVQSHHNEGEYLQGMREQMEFGSIVMALNEHWTSIPDWYGKEFLKGIVLHEIGHDFGLAHNFIGHNAYTLAQIRDRRFTERNGLVSSVMEYTPINLPAVGQRGGVSMNQTMLGTYDYHVIHWGYAPISGAKSPHDEVATLNRWASVWSDPRYRFASDEDAFWNGHAIDPRVEQFMLSNDPIGWCDDRMNLIHGLVQRIDQKFPKTQSPYEDERGAFSVMLGQYQRCAQVMSHYIGGEYLSRARRGDPNSSLPLTVVPLAVEKRAFKELSDHLFSDGAWNFSPQTLRRLVYAEYEPFANFGYNPTPRHDISVAQVAGLYQSRALATMFNPLTLQRIADLPAKSARGETMSLSDLFSWTQESVYGDIGKVRATTQVHRNLQRNYARLLSALALNSIHGTPYDAQSLARYELVGLRSQIGAALRRGDMDLQTRAHLEALSVDVDRALDAKSVVPAA